MPPSKPATPAGSQSSSRKSSRDKKESAQASEPSAPMQLAQPSSQYKSRLVSKGDAAPSDVATSSAHPKAAPATPANVGNVARLTAHASAPAELTSMRNDGVIGPIVPMRDRIAARRALEGKPLGNAGKPLGFSASPATSPAPAAAAAGQNSAAADQIGRAHV